MHNAYMIRNDGKEIPVPFHPYGDPTPEGVEYTLSVCEWLYDNTAHPEVKEAIIEFMASYGSSENPDDRIQALFDICGNPRDGFLDRKFVEKHKEEIEASKALDDVQSFNVFICNELNQEFLRARYGGAYDTERGSKEMVFRVSSGGFNWFPHIWDFVYKHRSDIETVTIVRDPESTGVKNYYYTVGGEKVDRMPVTEFLLSKGNPVVEHRGILHMGASLRENFRQVNMARINRDIKIIVNHETLTEYRHK